MGRKNLTNEEMIAVSAKYLDAKQLKLSIEGIAVCAALVPEIAAAHEALVELNAKFTAAELGSKLQQLHDEERKIDLLHDRKVRGIYQLLSAMFELTDLEPEQQLYEHLRSTLFPDALSVVNLTFMGESGNAKSVRQRIDDGVRAKLSAVKLPHGKTLNDEVNAWLDAGDLLGKLEVKRGVLEQAAERPNDVNRMKVAQARNRWFNVITALETTLSIASNVSSQTKKKILDVLYEAERQADTRVNAEESASEQVINSVAEVQTVESAPQEKPSKNKTKTTEDAATKKKKKKK